MQPKLTKKNKTLLMTAAGLIAISWFIPMAVKSYKREEPQQPKAQNVNENPTEGVTTYINDLAKKPNEEIANTLGLENYEGPLALTRVETTETTYNAENATVKARIYNFNSYLNSTFYLERAEKTFGDGEETKMNWLVKNMEVDKNLKFSNSGITFTHGFDWQVVGRDLGGEFLAQWSLKNLDPEKNVEITFVVEDNSTNFSEQMMDCSSEEIINCTEEDLGNVTATTAEYNNRLVKIYLIKTDTKNFLILKPNLPDSPELNTAMEGILKTIEIS